MERNFNFSAKEKIVRSGESKVFRNWNERAGVSMDEFLDGLRWLCDDPADGGPECNRLTRELGCIASDAGKMTPEKERVWGPPIKTRPDIVGLHRLTRKYYDDGSFAGFYYGNGSRWYSGGIHASISAMDCV